MPINIGFITDELKKANTDTKNADLYSKLFPQQPTQKALKVLTGVSQPKDFKEFCNEISKIIAQKDQNDTHYQLGMKQMEIAFKELNKLNSDEAERSIAIEMLRLAKDELSKANK